ncbi:hypothetical protein G7Y89_g2940 [Cudoniella acicularis]|uniref:NAD(P)-binding domain-containing protein n=1 Tax=Cudoniella acicularis TaxID=354080 RepID=A0A8H4RU54_9HELO|nr:hypothetical protein G7Y89_g2940 [Cudoniella acicularis]
MKIILTGATGFIGKEVLHRAVAHPSITSIACLTRRALPESVSTNPKVKVIILNDFLSYPPDVLSQLEGAEACIWCLGSPAMKNPSLEDSQKIEIGFTHAGAEVFCSSLASALKEKGKTFRFVLLSGQGAERDTTKNLWFLHNTRVIKGKAENGLLALQQKEGSNFEVSIMRPSGVLAKGTLVPGAVTGILNFIEVDILATAMVGEAVENLPGTRTLECKALRNQGLAFLNSEK